MLEKDMTRLKGRRKRRKMTKDKNEKRKRREDSKKKWKRRNMKYEFNSFYVICIFVPGIRHSSMRLERDKRDLHFPPTRKAYVRVFLRRWYLERRLTSLELVVLASLKSMNVINRCYCAEAPLYRFKINLLLWLLLSISIADSFFSIAYNLNSVSFTKHTSKSYKVVTVLSRYYIFRCH